MERGYENQTLLKNEQPPSVEQVRARKILDAVEATEKMHQPGSFEHWRMLSASVMSQWPEIKIILLQKAGRY